jgi:hypothetical protein
MKSNGAPLWITINGEPFVIEWAEGEPKIRHRKNHAISERDTNIQYKAFTITVEEGR